MKLVRTFLVFSVVVSFLAGCKKDDSSTTGPKLIFKFKFDPNQERLGNLGNPTPLPANHGGQNPVFNAMSAHYIELAQSALTPLGTCKLYKAEETTAGGDNAINFEKSRFAKDGEVFYEMPLKDIAVGDYEYLRVSLAYQNYDVRLTVDTTISGFRIVDSSYCTVASFIGYNTYIKDYKVKNRTLSVNDDKKQGYWGFEYATSFYGQAYNLLMQGQAPPNATTVVNPFATTLGVPAGSCLVIGKFEGDKLHITGKETKDIVVTVSLSTNKSFEWVEAGTPDGRWEPTKGEIIVDMGVRGLKPYVQY